MLTLFSKLSPLSLIALGSELYNLAPIKKKQFLANSSLTFGIRKKNVSIPGSCIVFVDYEVVVKVCTHLSI